MAILSLDTQSFRQKLGDADYQRIREYLNESTTYVESKALRAIRGCKGYSLPDSPIPVVADMETGGGTWDYDNNVIKIGYDLKGLRSCYMISLFHEFMHALGNLTPYQSQGPSDPKQYWWCFRNEYFAHLKTMIELEDEYRAKLDGDHACPGFTYRFNSSFTYQFENQGKFSDENEFTKDLTKRARWGDYRIMQFVMFHFDPHQFPAQLAELKVFAGNGQISSAKRVHRLMGICDEVELLKEAMYDHYTSCQTGEEKLNTALGCLDKLNSRVRYKLSELRIPEGLIPFRYMLA